VQAHTTLLPLLPALLNQMVWALQTPSTELNWLLSQPPFFTATHILPVTASLLHLIRKHLLYTELHRHHEQGAFLRVLKQITLQIIRNSPNPVQLFKVKSHAGIAGYECADAVAKYQATQVDATLADRGMPCAGIDGNPFYDITWPASERHILSDATSLRPSNLPAPSLIYFSNIYDALKTHMHSKYKVGHTNPTTGFYTNYKGSLP